MKIHIPSALRAYTKQQSEVEIEGSTLGEVLSAIGCPLSRFSLSHRDGTGQDQAPHPNIRE